MTIILIVGCVASFIGGIAVIGMGREFDAKLQEAKDAGIVTTDHTTRIGSSSKINIEVFDPANIDKIYKMYVSIPEEEEERLTLRDTVGRLRFVKEYLMFQPDDKKGGILRMMDLVTGGDDAALNDVVVFGDDTNDMVMFDPRFYGVAMGNGTDELKAMADYVTDASYEDGIWNACVKHGWFEKVE